MAEMTNEQKLRRKASLMRKLSDNDTYYVELLDQLDMAIEEINALPPDTSYLYIDKNNVRWVQGRIVLGNKDITDEFFGDGGELMVGFQISTLMLEAKKVQVLKEQAENMVNYQTLMSPEVLPQFDNIVSPPTTKIL